MRLCRLAPFLTLLLLLPARAEAQWYAGLYLGAATTRPAEVSVRGAGYDLTYQGVEFESKSFTSPQYYGWRVGRLLDAARRVGVELEFIHLKVIAKPETLGPDVTRYQMTHGLNYLVVNVVNRTPFGRSASGQAPWAFIARAGAGLTLPHAETTVRGASQEQYEYAGPGLHAALGLDARLRGRWSLISEYKITWARPRITTANGGTGQTTSLSHHLAVGFAFGLSR